MGDNQLHHHIELHTIKNVLFKVALLRYPGGKSRLSKFIWPYLQPMLGEGYYLEPFVGGGTMALLVARYYPQKEIVLNDLDPDVAAFWTVVSGHAGEAAFADLCRLVQLSEKPMDDADCRMDYWRAIKELRPQEMHHQAFRFLFLNKTCYGGQVNASPIGGIDQKGWDGGTGRGAGRRVACQYWVGNILSQLKKANTLLNGRTYVFNEDAHQLATLSDGCCAYFDPPYFIGRANKLYRKQMTMAEHYALGAFLKQWDNPWLLSYEDSESVRKIYDSCHIIKLSTAYSHAPGPTENERTTGKRKKWKNSHELLITSSQSAGHIAQSSPG
jgi:DNA adenine methylase